MGDVSVTATSVQAGTAATDVVLFGLAGATITAGQPLYKDSSDGDRLKPTDADVLASAACVGIATCNAADEQPVTYQAQGSLTFNAALTKGTPYFVSTTAGAMCLHSDLASGDFVTFLGVATSTTVLKLGIQVSGIAIT